MLARRRYPAHDLTHTVPGLRPLLAACQVTQQFLKLLDLVECVMEQTVHVEDGPEMTIEPGLPSVRSDMTQPYPLSGLLKAVSHQIKKLQELLPPPPETKSEVKREEASGGF